MTAKLSKTLLGLAVAAALPLGSPTAVSLAAFDGSTPNVAASGSTASGGALPIPDSVILLPAQQRAVVEQTPIKLAFDNSMTNRVINIIEQGRAECAGLNRVYYIDCIQQTLNRAAGAARYPDYRAARTDLRQAASQMKQLVDRNVDRASPAAKVGGRTYRAVAAGAASQLNRQAAAIVQEAETKLIRSAGSSQLRQTHYTRIAQAVGSTKTLLRS